MNTQQWTATYEKTNPSVEKTITFYAKDFEQAAERVYTAIQLTDPYLYRPTVTKLVRL